MSYLIHGVNYLLLFAMLMLYINICCRGRNVCNVGGTCCPIPLYNVFKLKYFQLQNLVNTEKSNQNAATFVPTDDLIIAYAKLAIANCKHAKAW